MPILEHSQQVATRHLRQDITLMQRLQRLATRLVNGVKALAYQE